MVDLTSGSVRKGIWNMSIPLITASFVQMAYNLTDMLWLGRLGSRSVAAVGVAGFFIWLCNSISFMPKVGGEVTISQSIGSGNRKRALIYARQSLLLAVCVAVLYSVFIFIAAPGLVAFFRLEPDVSAISVEYMRIVVPGLFFALCNNVFSGIYNGQGNSSVPLRTVSVGLLMNMILDPLMIYGYGPVPAMGTAGAAVATMGSQAVVTAIFIWRVMIRSTPLGRVTPFMKPRHVFLKRIVSLGLPVSLQSALFSVFSMTLGSMASVWGHVGVAVQSVGAQIEAVTWMTAAGFSTALASFTGQNYGARDFCRIRAGFRFTLKLALAISFVATVAFMFWGGELFSVFVNDPETVEAGRRYMFILAFSQMFCSLENVTAGSFNGLGRTQPPALTGVLLNGARLPMAYFLMQVPALGLDGIWLSITVSSIFKGLILYLWYRSFIRMVESGRNHSVRKGIYRPVKAIGSMMSSIASRLWQQ